MTRSPTEPTPLPDDDPARHLVHARPNADQNLRHISIAGNTYTFLVTGTDTAGRYSLIDMHIPPGGGPPPQGRSFVASPSATGSLGDPALDSEPRSAPWRGETAGGAGKDAPPALRAALPGWDRARTDTAGLMRAGSRGRAIARRCTEIPIAPRHDQTAGGTDPI